MLEVRLKNSKALLATNEALEQLNMQNDKNMSHIQSLAEKMDSGTAEFQAEKVRNCKAGAMADSKIDCLWEHLQLPSLREQRQKLANAKKDRTMAAELEELHVPDESFSTHHKV